MTGLTIERILAQLELPENLILIQDDSQSLDIADLKRKFEAGWMIALLEPSEKSSNTIIDGLGLQVISANVDDCEIVAFHRSSVCVFNRPISSMVVTIQQSTQTLTQQAQSNSNNTSELLKERVERFVSWAKDHLQENGPLLNTSSDISVLAAPSNDPSDLYKQATTFYGTHVVPIQMNIPSGQVQCHFQYSLYAQSVCTFTNEGKAESDWYLVTLNCMFQPAPANYINSGSQQAWYVDWYKVTIVPKDFINDSNETLTLESSGPPTKNVNDQSVSFSVGDSNSINASVGFFGETPTGNIGYAHSWSFGQNHSFDVQTCKIANLSSSQSPGFNDAHWEFAFPDPGTQNGVIEEAVPYARQGFSPIVSALWHMPSSARSKNANGFSIECSIDLQFVNAYLDGDSVQFQTYQISTDSSVSSLSNTWQIHYPPDRNVNQPTPSETEVTLAIDTDYFNFPKDDSSSKAGTFKKGTNLQILSSLTNPQTKVKWTKVNTKTNPLSNPVWIHYGNPPAI